MLRVPDEFISFFDVKGTAVLGKIPLLSLLERGKYRKIKKGQFIWTIHYPQGSQPEGEQSEGKQAKVHCCSYAQPNT